MKLSSAPPILNHSGGGRGGGGSPVYKLLVPPDKTVDGSGNPGAGAQVGITALNFLVFMV